MDHLDDEEDPLILEQDKGPEDLSGLSRRELRKRKKQARFDAAWGSEPVDLNVPTAPGMKPVPRPLYIPESFIDMREITKTFNPGEPGELTVIKDLSFSLEKGEFVAVVGASGSGKSTLMNIIGLLDRPTRGGYYFDGDDMLAVNDGALAKARSMKIGFVFQTFNLIGRISAQANVEMPMMYAGVPRKERAARAEELLAAVGMQARMSHNPNELSGGQKQRVAIARALANNPDLILADEPTGALDSKTGRVVMDLFHELNQQGKTILFITHNPELAAECDRSVTMVDGELVNEGGQH